jgi:preprotein translocase subunit SecG
MFYGLLVGIHVLVAALLMLVILMQAAKGGGLSGAFGTGMGSSPLFGAATSSVLVRTTTVLAVIFALTCISIAAIQSKRASVVGKGMKQPKREATVQPPDKAEASSAAKEGAATEKKEETLSPVEAGAAEKATGERVQPTTTELKPPAAEQPQSPEKQPGAPGGQPPTVSPEKPEAVAPPEGEGKEKEPQPAPVSEPKVLSPVEGKNPGETK